MDAIEVLDTMIQNVPGHWGQGVLGTSFGGETRACLVGHINWAISGTPYSISKYHHDQVGYYEDASVSDQVVRFIETEIDQPVVSWNDARGRTEEEVLALLAQVKERFQNGLDKPDSTI
jgi:hypothetical protein